MWDHVKVLPFGRLSKRNMWILAAAMVVASFACTLFVSRTVNAAEWNGSSIMHEGNEYQSIAPAKTGDSHKLPAGTIIYRYVEPTTSSANNPTTKAHLIYFAPGTDPTKATSGTYITYDFTEPNTYKNPSGKTTIALTPLTTPSEGTTSCDSTFTSGVGWIVCPVTKFLASAMDHLFDILAGFLTVRPVQTNQENALYRAWSYMRNFANVSFVIAFLIIIYSQVTSIGISNYDIKKMLPRLIVAAILVNISYWICAAAIDLSNIAGWSIQEIFISIRNNLVGSEGNSWQNTLSFTSVTGFILSGGTAAAAAGVGLYAFAAGAGGGIFMLIPILLSVLLAVLVALLVMAARQALITILVIVSPLAFVAYLLPNTEKYFTKWRELGTTMLMLFPIVSVVFGGSQLAGMAIIQNANSINLLLLGMAVQVAPVVITPLLVRFSGSLLARIGGIVNNPGKGLIDRSRKWSQEKADLHKNKAIAQGTGFLANRARGIDNRNRKRKGWTETYGAMGDANWANTKEYSDIQQKSFAASTIKNTGETNAEARYEASKRTNAAIQDLEFNARASKVHLDFSKAAVEADWKEIEAGNARSMIAPEGLSIDALRAFTQRQDGFAKSVYETSRNTKVAQFRGSSAERAQSEQFTGDLLENTAQIDGQMLREYGGGILGEAGAGTVFSEAVAKYRGEFAERVKEKVGLLHYFNPESNKRQALAMGEDITVVKNGITYTFMGKDDYAREAAIEEQLQKGSFGEVEAIIKETGERVVHVNPDGSTVVEKGRTHEYRTSIAEDIKKFSLDKKAAFFGAASINDIAQGKMNGDAGLNMAAARSITAGKISDEALSSMNASAIERLFKVTIDDVRQSEDYINKPGERANLERDFAAHQKALQHSAWRVMESPVLSRNAEEGAREKLARYREAPPTP